MNVQGPRWATLKQAAKHSGLSDRHLYNLIADGLIRSSLVKRPNASRGRRLVDLRSLDDWIVSGLMQMDPVSCTPNPEIQTGKEAS